LLLLWCFSVAGAHDFKQVQEGVGVEQVVAAFPEDLGKMGVETFQTLLHV